MKSSATFPSTNCLTFFFQVKINGQNQDMLRAAAEQFGGKEESEIAKGKKLENLITGGPWLLRIFRPLD